jgi:hypothetical protein
MTSQQRADEALALWRARKDYPEIEALLDEYFGIISRERYEEQLSAVSEEMGRCVIFTSDLPSHLSAAF